MQRNSKPGARRSASMVADRRKVEDRIDRIRRFRRDQKEFVHAYPAGRDFDYLAAVEQHLAQ